MKSLSRNKFLFTGISLGVMTFIFKWRPQAERPKSKVKLLTHDGRLVEVDTDRLPAAKHMASKDQVQNWIKK